MMRNYQYRINQLSIKDQQHGSVFSIELIDSRNGFVCFKVSGKTANTCFKNEAGGHRWQRVPPTEKKGRVQTSTITVAVIESVSSNEIRVNPEDLEWKFSRGTGPGGQHKNKTDTATQLTHRSSGIVVRCDGRSQSTNKETALSVLRAKLKNAENNKRHNKTNNARQGQIGSGMRGDKRRTIRVRDNQVVDHILNKKVAYREYVRGDFSRLR